MNILHLSDTGLSGSPIRIASLLNKHSGHNARHVVWEAKTGFREFCTDVVAPKAGRDQVAELLKWADVIHYHNRWRRQKIFTEFRIDVPKKPSLIQIHSPRDSEDFSDEVGSGLPLAVIAQYHVRQWPELSFIVPNVVDVTDYDYAREGHPRGSLPVVSYSPSNCNSKGWNDKGYSIIGPVLKRLKLDRKIYYDLIIGQPHSETIRRKKLANIGVDEVVTGSYHLSSLEYLAMGVPCIAYLDGLTERVVKDLTGASSLPWLMAKKDAFANVIARVLKDKSWEELGASAKKWMEAYWGPKFLVRSYVDMYSTLLDKGNVHGEVQDKRNLQSNQMVIS